MQVMAGSYEIRRINALLRFHFKINPDDLDDDDWAQAWGDLKFALEQEAKRTQQNTTL